MRCRGVAAAASRAPARAAASIRSAHLCARACVAGFVAALVAGSAEAQDRGRHVPFLYRNAELRTILEDLARYNGRRYLYDAKLRGRVTIAVKQPVTVAEAELLFDAALSYKGLALVPGPVGVLKVVESAQAATASPLIDDPQP